MNQNNQGLYSFYPTKADRKARKSDDLLKRDFYAEKPLKNGECPIKGVK